MAATLRLSSLTSGSYPGRIQAFDLAAGQSVLAQRDAFLFAQPTVQLNVAFVKKLGAGFFGGEGFILEKLTGPGLVFIHAGGDFVEFNLAAGESLQVDTGCIVAFDESVDYDIQFVGGIRRAMFGGEGVFLATVTGPGRVIIRDIQVVGPRPNKGNLVARFRGGSRKPLLLLAHLDVVEARREDWSMDPFHFLERDGYFYGRGTADDKSMAAIWVANLIRLKQEGFHPDRDIILALTAGEESGVDNGVEWLLTNHRDLIAAEVCLNEGAGGQIKDGKRIVNAVQPSEKVFLSAAIPMLLTGRVIQ